MPTVQGAMPKGTDFKQPPLAEMQGFSLNAGVLSGAKDRQALSQLCRYIRRRALAKTSWRDGITHRMVSALEFE